MKKFLSWKTNLTLLKLIKEIKGLIWFFWTIFTAISAVHGIINQNIFSHIIPMGALGFAVLMFLDFKIDKQTRIIPLLEEIHTKKWEKITRILLETKFKNKILSKMNNDSYQEYNIPISNTTNFIIKYHKDKNNIEYQIFDKNNQQDIFNLNEKQEKNNKNSYVLSYKTNKKHNPQLFSKIEKKLIDIYQSNENFEEIIKSQRNYSSLKEYTNTIYLKTKQNPLFNNIHELCATYLDLKDIYSANVTSKNNDNIIWLEQSIQKTLNHFEEILTLKNAKTKKESIFALDMIINEIKERLEETLDQEISYLKKNNSDLKAKTFKKIEMEPLYERS